MAAASGSITKHDCPICFEPYNHLTRTPRFLPCHHTLCHTCLTSLIDRRESQGSIRCPLCQKVTLVPPEKAFGFQVNFYLDPRHALDTEAIGPSDRSESLDDMRNQDIKVRNVRKCISMVEFSSEGLPVEYTYSNSRVSDYETARNELQRHQISFDMTPCVKHPRESIVLYCRQCMTGICILCKMTTHERHRSDDISDVAEAFRQQLRNDVTEMERSYTQIQNNTRTLQERKRDYACQVKVIRDGIITRKTDITRNLSHKTDRVLTVLDSLKSDKIQALNSDIEKCMANTQVITNKIANVRSILDTGRDVDIINAERATDQWSSVQMDKESQNIPLLLSSKMDTFPQRNQTDWILDVNKNPEVLVTKQDKAFRLTSAGTGVWAVSETKMRKIKLDGTIECVVKVSNVTDITSSRSGCTYVLLKQQDKWYVKIHQLGSFLSDFMDLQSAVDRIACFRDEILVLGTARNGRLSLIYTENRKWFKTLQIPCRYEKLIDFTENGTGQMAVLYKKSNWATEVLVLDGGGQILHKFSGNHGEGCHVTSMVSFCGGLILNDVDSGNVLLMSPGCEIECRLLGKNRIRKLFTGSDEPCACSVSQVVASENGVLWFLGSCGESSMLYAVQCMKILA